MSFKCMENVIRLLIGIKSWDQTTACLKQSPILYVCSVDAVFLRVLLQTDLLLFHLVIVNSGRTCKANLKTPELCSRCKCLTNY